MYVTCTYNTKTKTRGGETTAQRNKKHDHYLYVQKADFGLWDRFMEKHPAWSKVVMKLVRLYMEKKLYNDKGDEISL